MKNKNKNKNKIKGTLMDSDIIHMQNIHRRRWFFASFEILYDRNEI